MKIFRKIGNAFKWLGSKALWVIRRNETLFAVQLASGLVPIPALRAIVLLVTKLDQESVPGVVKMAMALEAILPILEEWDITVEEKSDLRLLIELAVSIMKGKSRIIPKDDE